MKLMIGGLIMLLCCGAVRAESSDVPLGQTVLELPWTQADVTRKGGFPCPPFYPSNPGPARIDYTKLSEEPGHFELNVSYSGSDPYPLQLWNVSESLVGNIESKHYAIVGEVRYENVSPGNYLEMWSYFGSPFPRTYPEAGAYFSRTLAESGPMGKLQGTHDWREFWLPFDATGATGGLKNVVVNLQLAGPGTVHLRKLRLVQYPGVTASWGPHLQTNAWWTERTAGLIGGIVGSFMGICGSILYWLASRNTSPVLVSRIFGGLIALSALFLGAGIAAILLAQPYLVWFPLLVIGAVGVGIFSYRFWQYRHIVHDRELRRMESLDI